MSQSLRKSSFPFYSILAFQFFSIYPVAAILDTNLNGLSDVWENQHNATQLFTPSNPAHAPTADPDQDGWTNAQESLAGTNPFDSSIPTGKTTLRITPAAEAATYELTWPVIAGKSYRLQASTNLATWITIGEIINPEQTATEHTIGVGTEDPNAPTTAAAPRLFWRIRIGDQDTDSDGISNADEIRLGLNPQSASTNAPLSDYWLATHFLETLLRSGSSSLSPGNDIDGDGLSNSKEAACGTHPNNPDTDSDGIPDSLDLQPLISMLDFQDADQDGIPDENDAAPYQPRNVAPCLTSENTPGNPISNLIKDDLFAFVITASNPSGQLPTAENLSLYVNGVQETASIAALGSAVGSTQRFLLSWQAKTATGYPSQTLQNLTLRFRDSQNATAWLQLARIDVAEWEGMIGAVGSGDAPPTTFGTVNSHYNGKRIVIFHESLVFGFSRKYRGPKMVSFHDPEGEALLFTANIEDGVRYPLFFISHSDSGVYSHYATRDISLQNYHKHHVRFICNNYLSDIRVNFSLGADLTIPHGDLDFLTVPDAPNLEDTVGVRNYYYDDNGTEKAFSSSQFYVPIAQSPYRLIYSETFQPHEPPVVYRPILIQRNLNNASVEWKIQPHAAGSLEHTGLPLANPQLPLSNESNEDVLSPQMLPMAQGALHKIQLKVGSEAVSVSNGIGLWLRNANEDPQAGFSAKVQKANGDIDNLSIPADGKITFVANSPDWQKITSAEGLTIFLSRDSSLTELHELSLELLKKESWHPNESTRMGSMRILPLDTVVGDARSMEAAQDSFLVPEADPTPSVEMNIVSASLQGENLMLRVQGVVRDAISAFAVNQAERVQVLQFYHQSQLLHSIPLDASVSEGDHFDENIVIPAALPQAYVIRAVTTENIAGNKGYDESSISLTWNEDPSSFPPLPTAMSLALQSGLSQTSSDQATLTLGAPSQQLTVALTETQPNSLQFTGSLLLSTAQGNVAVNCLIKLRYPPTLSAGAQESMDITSEFTAPGYAKNQIHARWKETGNQTLQFSQGDWTFGHQALQIGAIHDLHGTARSNVEACTLRISSLPQDWVDNGLRVVVGGVAYSLIEKSGQWYPEDPQRPGEVKRFAPSSGIVPSRLAVPGYVSGQGLLAFSLRFSGMDDLQAAEIAIVPSINEEDRTVSPSARASRSRSANNANATPPWKPGDALVRNHVIWAYRFLNANDSYALELLDGYTRGGHQIEVKDLQIGYLDTDVTLNDLFTDTDNIWKIQIEEDTNPVHAARLLLEGLKQVTPYREVFRHYSFEDDMDEILAFKAALATAVQKTQETAISATELYLSGLGIINEGLDWIIVIDEVSKGHYEALAGALPFIPSGLIKAQGRLIIRNTKSEVLDTLGEEAVAAMIDLALNGNLATAGTVYDEYNYSEYLRKVFSSNSSPIRPPGEKEQKQLREQMEAISPRPSSDYDAHHDFPWSMREWFADHGINVNDPAYGRWVKRDIHRKWHGNRGGKFHAWWSKYIDDEKAIREDGGNAFTKQQIIQKLIECRTEFPSTL